MPQSNDTAKDKYTCTTVKITADAVSGYSEADVCMSV